VVQGAAAYFNAQTFTKQADDALKNIKEQASEVERRYPIFARQEAFRREAYASLADIFSDPFFLDWRISAYERLDLLDRQKLLSVERFIGIELLPHPGGPDEYVRDLRRLANFYASKHRYDCKKNQAQWADLERAEYYLRLAIREAGNNNFHLTTDLGVLFMDYYVPRRLDDAEAKFRESLHKMKNQQRAAYNLGVVERHRGNLKEALKHYNEALGCKDWERGPVPVFHCALLYNKACALARLSYETAEAEKAGLVTACLDALTQASGFGQEDLNKVVDEKILADDLNKDDGGFAKLDDATKAKIRDALTAKPSVSPLPLTQRQRVMAALKILSGKA
jgi:hypothetical protein